MFPSLSRAWRKLVLLTRREQLGRELAEELELHLQLKQKDAEETGMPAQVAAEESRRAMGNITLAREQSNDIWAFLSIEQLLHDIRYALRSLRTNLGFSAVAILSLALGIAGTTAIFSIINALLIRPLPFMDPSRLVRITELYPKAILEYFRQHLTTMDIASVSPGFELNLTSQGPAVRITASETSANFWSVFGVSVERGRTFNTDEDRPGQDGVVILSHELWKTKFQEDPDVVGRTIVLGGVNRRIVGVAPSSFSFPSRKVQLWIPVRIDPRDREDYWGGAFVPFIARLRPGVTIEQAQGEIHSLAPRVWKLFPWPMPRNWNAQSKVMSLQTDLAGGSRDKLFVLLGAVGIVLIIACANVASLLLARAITRRKEMALRAALGAGGVRIVRQLLTESVVLALAAGGVGVLLGTAAVSLFQSIVPSDILGAAQIGIDWRVAAFAATLSVVTGLSFGIVPAFSARSFDLVDAMKTGSQRSTTSNWMSVRNSLIVGEIALTLVLLVGAGLLIKSLYALSFENPGFETQRILTVKISPNESFCQQREACIAFYDRLLQRIRSAPEVISAALVNTLPLTGELPAIAADVEGHPRTPDFPSPMLWAGAITSDYLRLMGIPMLSGRAFTEADGSNTPRVVLISASTAKRFWPGTDPIGKHIKRSGDGEWRTIVGVVPDVKQFSLSGRPVDWLQGAVYMPYAQAVQGNGDIPVAMNLLVKTTIYSERTAAAVRRLAVEANPNVPVGKIEPLDQIAHHSISSFRSTIWIFLTFAGVALLLTEIGMYGLMSYSVSQRTYEISVRMAIGAQASSVIGSVLGQSLRVTALGLATGIVVALLLTRLLSGLLFHVQTTDRWTFAGVALLLAIVAVAASSIPAWRASRIDSIKTLRAE
jgi:putative ABC transport system permease protein